MSEFASEGGHWYRKDGTPAYTVIATGSGAPRPTTLRDAKKFGLVPSVTTIIRLAAAPALERYKIDKAILAALRHPQYETEDLRTWLDRVTIQSREEAFNAADIGTLIHGAIEKRLRGEKEDEIFKGFADCVQRLLNQHFPGVPWEMERSFAADEGYGGKVDLHSKVGVVVDFKTKDKITPDLKCWDDHFMQTASYRHGLGMPEARCANIFVSRSNPPEAMLIEHKPEELSRGWRMFLALLEFHKAKTGLG